MRSLIWKEWHEQGWKLVLGCIVIVGFAGIGLRTRVISDQEMVLAVCMVAVGLVPLLAATGLVPAERSEGTLEALTALPVTRRKILAVKLGAGLAQSVVPLVAALVVSLAIAGGREMSSGGIVDVYGRSILTAAMLFLWMFATTAGSPSEARAGMVGVGVLVFWLMATLGIMQQHAAWLMGVSPLSFLADGINEMDGAAAREVLRSSGLGPGEVLRDAALEIVIAIALVMWARWTMGRETLAD